MTGTASPFDPFQRAAAVPALPDPASSQKSQPQHTPFVDLYRRFDEACREEIAALNTLREAEKRMMAVGFKTAAFGIVNIQSSAAGDGGMFDSVDAIAEYYAPAIAIHGESWIAIRDGWAAKLQKVLAARAFFDLDRLDAVYDEAANLTGKIEDALCKAPAETMEDLFCKLRALRLIRHDRDPDVVTDVDNDYFGDVLGKIIADAERLAGSSS